jgi:hypothetical protein
MARVKNTDFFMALVILLPNLVACYWNMSMTRKKGHNANAAASRNLGGPTDKYTIENAVKLVSFSFLSAPDKFPL